MADRPLVRCGSALVVFEGTGRLPFRRDGSGEWRADSLWPGPQDAQALEEYLADGSPMLIVLNREPAVVSLTPTEFSALPPGIGETVGTDSEIIDIEIPRLNWLPDSLRERGLRHLANASGTLREVPALMLPPLLLDNAERAAPQVRFAVRASSAPLYAHQLEQVILHVFAD
ncbi:hypothetical protein OG562_23910 [Streptomyces sp. NBC_01275]|uniref:hypothetical protein n=1 Tax=Streptomyces sp. NBC_01275 TaxID=2903807 RepID=UPI00225B677B|nr:hypothetical protein [Streptomyces sp. NBC_01275]MCX4763950.1 hypothetical protein [Streptomyces sp. NBC_01275]